jgi:3-hydroxyisobutyrate dehydrogenase-like beta-hydroxyacid dehydrogenase
MTSLRIGFIGLGQMGGGMAARLVDADFVLTVHDVRREAAVGVLGQGARWADSPLDTAEASDVVCTSLPGPDEAADVYLGEAGVLRGLQAGAVCIDFSTNAPALVQRIAHQVVARGGAMLDAPVSGGVEAARTGELTVLVGGDAQAIGRVRPILDVLAATVLHVGEVGAASICKVLHNCAVFCTNLAMMECFTVGLKAGVPATTLVEVFQKSGIGRNLDLQVAMPATIFRGNFEPRFLMSLAAKDISLATELARQVEAPMELADLCERDMAAAIQRGWADRDNTIFLTLREERTGVEVRVPTVAKQIS